MSQLRSFAALAGVVCIGVILLLASSATAGQLSSASTCKLTVKGHPYKISLIYISCSKAKTYVQKLAAERLSASAPGGLSWVPTGYKCSALSNMAHVQTFGSCSAKKGEKGFTWSLVH